MKKQTILIIIAVVIVAAFAAWWHLGGKSTSAPSVTPTTYVPSADDSTTSIDQELDRIDTGADVEADFEATNKDIETL